MQYCHEQAIPGSMVLHRDLKPDNIGEYFLEKRLFPLLFLCSQKGDFGFLCTGFTLDGTVKIIDFGLSRILENSDPKSNEVYAMSGETGSLRYMAPGKRISTFSKSLVPLKAYTVWGYTMLNRGCGRTSLQPQSGCLLFWSYSLGVECCKEAFRWFKQRAFLRASSSWWRAAGT
jgi:serine/threonine protein kinase